MPSLLQAAAESHPGRIRPVNQDAVLADVRAGAGQAPRGLFIVADGIGGHLAGEVASRLAVDTVRQALEPWLDDVDAGAASAPAVTGSSRAGSAAAEDLSVRLWLAVQGAQVAIARYGQEHPEEAAQMGSTLTCALVDGPATALAHVGDSRAYRLHEGLLEQLTRDHSYVAELVESGDLEPEAVYTHPQRHVLVRALGGPGSLGEVEVDLQELTLIAGDRLLLCSDGLWEMVRDPEIEHHLRDALTPDAAVQRLVQAANAYGGVDNIGVVVVDVVAA
jgi:protein phosphatase